MLKQNQMLAEYLKANGTITAADAVYKLGIMRLSARIFDLREQGYNISMTMRSARNRFGNPITFGEYKLEGAPDDGTGQLRIL